MAVGLDYTSRDYDGLKASLIAYAAQNFPEWNPSSEGDFGMLMLELMAYVGDVNSYYVDRAQQEAYLGTATQRSSVLQIAALLGYTPGNGTPAQGTVYVVPTITAGGLTGTAPTNINVPPGTQFTTGYLPSIDGQITFEYLGRTSIPVSASGGAVAVPITEGQTIVDPTTGLPLQIGLSDGTPAQILRIPNPKVYLDSVKVYVAGTQWAVVPRLIDHGPNDQVCSLFTDEQGYTWIQFGDAINGAIPNSGLAITTQYRIGYGAAGNVGPGMVTSLFAGTPAGVSIQVNPNDPTLSTSTQMTGGANPETIDQIRVNAPNAFAIQNRVVTINDYNAAATSIPSVAKANPISSFYTNVNVFILGADGSGALAPTIPPPTGLSATAVAARVNLATVPQATQFGGPNTDFGPFSQYFHGTYSLASSGGPGSGGFSGPAQFARKSLNQATPPAGDTAFQLTLVSADQVTVASGAATYPIAASKTYTVSAWVRSSKTATPQLVWTTYTNTGANATATATLTSNEYGSGTIPANTWTRVSFTITTAANSSQLAAYVSMAGGTWVTNDTMDVSGVLLEQASTVGYYFDGSCSGCTWNGTAGASTSNAGILPVGTYSYIVTALNTNGETLRSTEFTVATTGVGAVSLSWNAVAGATSYRVYRGTAPASENAYLTNPTGTLTGTSLVDIGATTTTATPPVSSTAVVSGGATSSLVTKVQNTLQSMAMAGVTVNVTGALPVTVDLGLTSADWPVVQILNNYSQATLSAEIASAVQGLFSLANISIGQKVSLAAIYQAIMSVPGVQYVQIPGMYRDDAVHTGATDIQLQPWEYPVLNPNFSASTMTINGGF